MPRWRPARSKPASAAPGGAIVVPLLATCGSSEILPRAAIARLVTVTAYPSSQLDPRGRVLFMAGWIGLLAAAAR